MSKSDRQHEEIENLLKLVVSTFPKDKESKKLVMKTALVSLTGLAVVKVVDYLIKTYNDD